MMHVRQFLPALGVAATLVGSQGAVATPLYYLTVVDSAVDPAMSGGVATGVNFRKGQWVMLSATGTMTLHHGSTPIAKQYNGTSFGYYGPAGIAGTSGTATAPACNAGALVGSIAGGSAHCVNNAATWQAETTGQLYLYVNDQPGYYGDNLGSFDVLIKAP